MALEKEWRLLMDKKFYQEEEQRDAKDFQLLLEGSKSVLFDFG